MFDADTAQALTLRLAAISAIINCSEILLSRGDHGGSGLLNWDVIRTVHPLTTRGVTARWLNLALRNPNFFWLVLVVSALATLLALDPAGQWRFPILAAMTAGWLLVTVRLRYGLDGSDQMLSIVLISACMAMASQDRAVAVAVTFFLTFQLALSWLAAGIAKLVSSEWRSGRAMPEIMRMRSYGSGFLTRVFRRWPWLARPAAWTVILYECVGPWMIFVSPEIFLGFLCFGLLFHFATAVFMGLNCFFWSFAAAYPSAYLISFGVSRWKAGEAFTAAFG